MKKKLFSLLIISCILFGGCGQSSDPEDVKEKMEIGVITKSKDSEYWMSIVSGMERAAAALDVSVIILSPDTETDDEIQTKMVYDMLDRGLDALAVAPIDSGSGSGYVEYARSLGIPVYSYDTRILDTGTPHIGIDNAEAGRSLATFMSGQMKGQGTVGIISGSLEQSSYEERVRGFQEYLDEETEMESVFWEKEYSSLRMPEKDIEEFLKENPDISAVFATSAVTALSIADFLQEKEILLTSVDMQSDSLEALQGGKIAALVPQDGNEIGYETIRYIAEDKVAGSGSDLILRSELVISEDWK